MHRVAPLLVLLTASTISGTSRAAPVEQPSTPIASVPNVAAVSESPRRWYGWKILAVDAFSASVFGAAALLQQAGHGRASDAAVVIGIGSFALGPSFVHFSEGNWGRGLGSIGVRAGAPLVGAGLGLTIELSTCRGGEYCGIVGGVLGGAAGIVAAMAVDSAVLAWGAPVTIAPIVGGGRLGLGISGTF